MLTRYSTENSPRFRFQSLLVALALSIPVFAYAGGGGGTKQIRVVRVKNLSASASQGSLVSIDTVEVGDPNNTAASVNGSLYGAVTEAFRMGKYEVTIEQYAAFLNAVAKTTEGVNGAIVNSLYDSRMSSDANVAGIERTGQGTSAAPYSYSVVGDGKKPIAYVTWFNAARFANWMHNGAIVGADTETGAYTLNGATSGTITKNPGAKWWIPSENEWFKAAYYKGGGANAGYWRYPTQSNDFPDNSSSAGSNQANFLRNGLYSITQVSTLDAAENYLTAIGTFANCPSAYGTFDQGGNVDEWTDTVIATGFGDARITRGGAWNSGGLNHDVSPVSTALPGDRLNKLGFRLARAATAGGDPTTLSGNFDVRVGPAEAPIRRVNAGEVVQFSIRPGSFTVEAQDAINPSLKSAKTFTTGSGRINYITVANSGGQITISQAPADANF